MSAKLGYKGLGLYPFREPANTGSGERAGSRGRPGVQPRSSKRHGRSGDF